MVKQRTRVKKFSVLVWWTQSMCPTPRNVKDRQVTKEMEPSHRGGGGEVGGGERD